jgi:hypothetical protein
MEDVLEFKKHVDSSLKTFSDSINALSSILLYKKQLKKQIVNDFDRGKKKFCSNVNNNVDDEHNNNNNTKLKKHRTCCYSETDAEGGEEYKLGETDLEKHERLLEYQIRKVPKLRAQEKRRKEKENRNLEVNMNDELHLHPVVIQLPETTSDSSSNINSTDTPLIISPTSSPVIPALSSKNTIIKVRSSNGKPLPEKIDSNNPKGKWNKITKEKIDSSNISSTTNKSPTPNDVVKIKRKRDEVRQTSIPSFVYTEETSVNTSVNTSSVNNSNDDIDSDNDDQVDDSTVADATTSDPGAFESDSTASNNNNN